jgi:hypothetical protein
MYKSGLHLLLNPKLIIAKPSFQVDPFIKANIQNNLATNSLTRVYHWSMPSPTLWPRRRSGGYRSKLGGNKAGVMTGDRAVHGGVMGSGRSSRGRSSKMLV